MNTYKIEKDGPMWIVTQNGEFIDGGWDTKAEAKEALEILDGMRLDEIDPQFGTAPEQASISIIRVNEIVNKSGKRN